LAKWLKKEGDKVKSGDVIAEIETDKATMEVEAVDEGTLAKIVVPEGTQDVAVNDVIAVLAGEGEDVKAAGGKNGRSAPPKPGCGRHPAPQAAPRKHHRAAQTRPPPRRLRRPPAPVAAAPAPQANGHANASSPRRWRGASPRKPASISRINGSGPHGRVIARDVEDGQIRQGPARRPRRPPAPPRPIAPRCRTSRSARCSRRQLRGRAA
jgi:pyruvate dehydrogenase E2 component (dihydrolipoamide acetyltransferase)